TSLLRAARLVLRAGPPQAPAPALGQRGPADRLRRRVPPRRERRAARRARPAGVRPPLPVPCRGPDPAPIRPPLRRGHGPPSPVRRRSGSRPFAAPPPFPRRRLRAALGGNDVLPAMRPGLRARAEAVRAVGRACRPWTTVHSRSGRLPHLRGGGLSTT